MSPSDPVMASMKDYLATNSADSPPFDVECLLQTGDNAYNWFRVRGQALWNKDGKPVRMAGSITDITGRRNWEEEQARLIANLAIARDKAEKAAKARSEFLAVSANFYRNCASLGFGVWDFVSVLVSAHDSILLRFLGHEPRDSNSIEWSHRHGVGSLGHSSHSGTGRMPGNDKNLRGVLVVNHQ